MKIVLVFLLFFTPYLSAFEYQPQGIEVTGKAEVEAQPDVFIAHFTLSKKGTSASKIKSTVDHQSKLIVDKALSMGIAKSDIQSARISLWSTYEEPSIKIHSVDAINKVANGQYVNAKTQQNKNEVGNKKLYYHASRQVTFKIRNIDGYEKLLDMATKIGVAHVSPLEMQFSQAEALYQQALALAITNAQNKAESIAKQANRQLGNLVYLKEVSYGAPAHRMMMMSDSSSRFSPEVGKKTNSAQVIATFSMQ